MLVMMFFRQTESLCTSAQTKLAPLNMDSAFSSYEYDCPAKYAPKASASRIRTAEIMRPIRPLPAFVTSIVFYHSPQHRCRLKYQMFFQNTNHLSRATFFIALCLIVFCERCEKNIHYETQCTAVSDRQCSIPPKQCGAFSAGHVFHILKLCFGLNQASMRFLPARNRISSVDK